jgi:hypothetical protein
MLRKKKPTPQYPSHPDPAIEVVLARIRSLQLITRQKEQRIVFDNTQIEKLRRSIRRDPNNGGTSQRRRLIDELNKEIVSLEQEIRKTHDEIARHFATLNINDQAYLGAVHDD